MIGSVEKMIDERAEACAKELETRVDERMRKLESRLEQQIQAHLDYVGYGLGELIQFNLRHILKDRTQQEAAFVTVKDRKDIDQPTTTGLKNKTATKNAQEYIDKDNRPNPERVDGDGGSKRIKTSQNRRDT